MLHSVMTLLFVTLPPLLVDGFGFSLVEHWKIYVPAMLGSIIFMLPILRRVGANLSEHRMLPWAFFVLALAVGILPVSANLGALGVLLALYFLGFNLLEASMPALLSRLTGSRGRGRRLGLYSTFQFLGAFFGGVAGGWLLGYLRKPGCTGRCQRYQPALGHCPETLFTGRFSDKRVAVTVLHFIH